jgi:predicted transcriptional regulator
MMNDPLNNFLNEMQGSINKLTEKTNSMCSRLDKLEERFLNMEIKLEANKLVHNEKSESSNYKLSVLEEKINSNNQKVTDLNNILMKHFAYKNIKNSQSTPQNIPQNIPSIPQSNTITPQSNTTSSVPNPFAMPSFGAK